jgi:hypothetical protein
MVGVVAMMASERRMGRTRKTTVELSGTRWVVGTALEICRIG